MVPVIVESSKRKLDKNRNLSIFDTFISLTKNLRFRRHCIADFVYVDTINKVLEYSDEDAVTVYELLKIIRSPIIGIGPQISEEYSNNSGIFVQSTKTKKPINKTRAKRYNFYWCDNEKETPFKDYNYNWRKTIDKKSFGSNMKNSLKCKDNQFKKLFLLV